MKKKNLFIKIALLLAAVSVIGFCIITNSSGDYRSYWADDLPFVIQLNEGSPVSYDAVIQAALDGWNNVEGSYFEFVLGDRTTEDSPGLDGVNLLYFDTNNDNFAPGTNTIAFSSTRTSNTGGYHAIESDYIYNAAGYPPATDGNPSQMDLMTITLHEIGHHMGLNHHGPAGNDNGAGSSGCGVNLPNQVMYWSVGLGSLKRELLLHDRMGATAIYPNFIVNGTVTDATTGEPIENAKLVFDEDTYGAYVGEVESAVGRDMRPGEVYSEGPTLDDGSYFYAMNKQNFTFTVQKFGYEPTEVQNIDFSAPVGYGDTQVETNNFELTPTSRVTLSGAITNEKTGTGAQPEIVISWVDDEGENQTTVADENGDYAFEVPSNAYYKVEFYFNPPFEPYYVIDSVLVGSTNAILDFAVTPSNLLFVYDGNNAAYSSDYKNSLKRLGYGYVEWNSEIYGETPQPDLLTQFNDPLTILWVAGGDATSNLTPDDITSLEDHLANGQRLIMAGRNIVELEDSNDGILFSDYAGVTFAGNSSGLRVLGYDGDLIGDGVNSLMLGAGKDLFQISETALGTVNGVLYYGAGIADTNNLAAVRSQNEDEGWKFILFSDGLDKMAEETVDTLLARSIAYAGSDEFVTGVKYNLQNEDLPNIFSISQNYPNPFNPSTTIRFAIPVNANVKLAIYNILGEQVDVLKDGMMNAGSYEMNWDATASSLSSGIYFYRIQADGINGARFNDTKKMILLK